MQQRQEDRIIEYVRDVLNKEAQALSNVQSKIGEAFVKAVEMILKAVEAGGRVIITGVGKSGIVGKKIAATMASLGIPSYFVHADEALHGDLGMIQEKDVVIAISHSGKTQELLATVSHIKSFGNAVVAIAKDDDNPLAHMSDVTICTHVEHEADHMNTAPTASSTTTLALGDALAITLARLRKFGKEDFLRLHPGGALGEALMAEKLRSMN